MLFVYLKNYQLDNDGWFLLNHGRYVFNHGIPYVEPFTIHKELSFVMQQWLSSLFFYLFYHFFGIKSLLFFVIIFNYLFVFIMYKLCMLLSDNNYKISSIITFLIDFILVSLKFIVLRPQIFTYILIVLMFYCLESYIKKRNIKYLFMLPVISILQINMHASMWWLLYVFMLPYLIDGFGIKAINSDKYKKIPLILTMIFMFLFALINPYGIDSLIYFFNSYGIKEINSFVFEMKPVVFNNLFSVYIFSFVVLVFILYIYVKNRRIKIRYLLLLFGSLLLGLSSYKGLSYFFFISLFPVSYFYSDKIRIIKYKERYSIEYKRIYGSLVIIMLLVFGFYYSYKGLNYHNNIEEGINFLLDNYEKNDIKLYVGYNQGGYTEFRGIKSYIDPRAEVFLKKNNKKEDIFIEYYNVLVGNYDLKKFLKKYNFTHLLIVESENLYDWMKEIDNYKIIYEGKVDNKESYKIYVKS